MKAQFAAAVAAIGALFVIGWFGFTAYQAKMAPPTTEMVGESSPMPAIGSDGQYGTTSEEAGEQLPLSEGTELSEIEADVDATVIYNENGETL